MHLYVDCLSAVRRFTPEFIENEIDDGDNEDGDTCKIIPYEEISVIGRGASSIVKKVELQIPEGSKLLLEEMPGAGLFKPVIIDGTLVLQDPQVSTKSVNPSEITEKTSKIQEQHQNDDDGHQKFHKNDENALIDFVQKEKTPSDVQEKSASTTN